MALVKIMWIYRRTGRGGTDEAEIQLGRLLTAGWEIISTSTTVAKDGVPILCVVLQNLEDDEQS